MLKFYFIGKFYFWYNLDLLISHKKVLLKRSETYLSTKPERGGGPSETAQPLPTAPQKGDDAGGATKGGDCPRDRALDHGGGGRRQGNARHVLNLTRQI